MIEVLLTITRLVFSYLDAAQVCRSTEWERATDMKLMVTTCFAMLMFSGAAVAAGSGATLDVLQGRALVNLGQGFVPVAKGQILHQGDSILLAENGAAILSSSETGCVLSIRKAGTYRVPNLEACVAGQAAVLDNNFKVTPVNGYPDIVVDAPPPPIGGISPVVIGVGSFGLALAAAGFVEFLAKDNPVSSN